MHPARIISNIPEIMSDGDFPHKLKPDESFEVRAWGFCQLIGSVGEKKEGNLLYVNGYFKDQAGNIHECDGPTRDLYLHEVQFPDSFQ